MKKIMNWVLAATLVCGASVFTACSDGNDDNPNKEQAKRYRTEFVQHTRKNLKDLAENLNFTSWNAANALNQNFNRYVLNNPEFEKAVLNTFLKNVLATVKPVEEGSELAERGFTAYGTVDLTKFNYRFVMNDDNTGFDVEEGDDFEVIINGWHPEKQQVEKGLYKVTLKAGGSKSYKFVYVPKELEDVAFVINLPSEFQFAISDKISGTWSDGFSGSFVNMISSAEGREYISPAIVNSWGVSGIVNTSIPATPIGKADQTTLKFSLLSDKVNHKANTAFSWEQNGLKLFDLAVKGSRKMLDDTADMPQSAMSSSFVDVLAAALTGCSIDEAKLTLLDDLTVTTTISDMGKVTKVAHELAAARRNYADMKTIDQYTQQLNKLVKSEMTCKGLDQTISMKMMTIKFGVDYWTVGALNFADENGYVAITDMLDKESIEYMLNIVDHSIEPMQQGLVIVRQLVQYVQGLVSGFQSGEDEE